MSDILIVIPTLNEARHIGDVLDRLADFTMRRAAKIVVVDGGSTDGTQDIVRQREVTLLPNPQRIQSAGINLAVQAEGHDKTWLIRIDAHSAYPDDYCDVLLAEAEASGADSVVVGMQAEGESGLQRAIAAAQNSRFGNGGSAHRIAPTGRFVDHGHHALMRISAFRAVGGYDAAFSHNEDAELDRRLTDAGFRIWLTQGTRLVYFPRHTVGGLMRQYFNFGKGRAQNQLKHGLKLRLRQLIVAGVAPALILSLLAPLHPLFAAPVLIWANACLFAGILIAHQTREPRNLIAGFMAGLMHAAWSGGFVSGIARGRQTVAMRAGA